MASASLTAVFPVPIKVAVSTDAPIPMVSNAGIPPGRSNA
jgi:hypothetical protein